jgi:hypothetical protein
MREGGKPRREGGKGKRQEGRIEGGTKVQRCGKHEGERGNERKGEETKTE